MLMLRVQVSSSFSSILFFLQGSGDFMGCMIGGFHFHWAFLVGFGVSFVVNVGVISAFGSDSETENEDWEEKQQTRG